MSAATEIARRRTFAIISHPDAGKTTLTEKFLLYGNAVHLAGAVKDRKNQRATRSDWMELERQRGISVSSTVLQFEYGGCAVNLLDTPGHKDFSEDTYRVLTAVDAAVMVIDAAKGIETQTRKLFEVCRLRGVPIFTFMNKCDRPTRDPLVLLDELENVLGLQACAVTWLLGNGPSFRGVYDRLHRHVHLFERVPGGAYRAPEQVAAFSDPVVRARLDEPTYHEVAEQLAMLEGAGHPFDLAAVHAGRQTPVYFGSAVNNFGVELLLNGFLRDAVPPQPRRNAAKPGDATPSSCRAGGGPSSPSLRSPEGVAAPSATVDGALVAPSHGRFSGFIFKIQANMDPKHRDRIAFVRVCSGRFVRDMTVLHQQSGRRVRLSSSHKLFGQERETVDEAWPGDIIGLVGYDLFGIGDTLTEDSGIRYDEIPRFPPEVFAFISNPNPADAKKYRAGLEQLLQEHIVQSFALRHGPSGVTLLAAVGPLQFEVVQWRLQAEYGAEARIETAPWQHLRWLEPHPALENPAGLVTASGVAWGADADGRPVILFPNDWTMSYFVEKNPGLVLHSLPPRQ
ncbi:MAG: GTP-binding protein [Opitutaceae bacterium]|nr:GTP-binding protein [Opitutaceae bacterium]